ncbi:MAG: hypothetical protein Q7K26_01605 [bacterium]|nr:hypothetical protein [bacterium]
MMMNEALKIANGIGKFRGAGKDLHDIVLVGSRLGIPVSTGLAEQCAENYETAAKSINGFLDKAEKMFQQQASADDMAAFMPGTSVKENILISTEHENSFAPRG